MLAVVPRYKFFDRLGRVRGSTQKRRTAQNIKDDRQTLPEPLGLTGDNLLGRAMACSLWDSLQRLRGYSPHLIQRTSSITWLPNSLSGQATWPPGGCTSALPQLSKSSTNTLRLQAAPVVPVTTALSKSSTTTLCLQVLSDLPVSFSRNFQRVA